MNDGSVIVPRPPISEQQFQVAQEFFALPESAGYLLAGAAGLVAHGMTTRPTYDLDLFTGPDRGGVVDCRNAFIAAAQRRSWKVEIIRDGPTFSRLSVSAAGGEVIVDLAVDASPLWLPSISVLGPTFSADELAGRKVVALFDRAAARDFADVFELAGAYSKSRLCDLAKAIDPGFDEKVLAQMFGLLDRYTDEDLPVDSDKVVAVRAFFADWAAELNGSVLPDA